RAFGAAVPAVVVVAAVAVVLPVRLVVLAVVGDEVAQGEAVVGGDEVGAGPGPAPAPVVDVGGAGDARGELGELVAIALPELPHRVAVLVVPLRPAGREAADLVAAHAGVPRLRDQLGGGEHRI